MTASPTLAVDAGQDVPPSVARSDELHREVRAFAARDEVSADDFEALALKLAQFQAQHVAGFARLVDVRASSLDSLESIPAVPADAFRLSRVAAHPAELDVARFHTSGTTKSAPGVHAFRTTETYERVALAFGRPALAPERGPRVIVALAPPPSVAPHSSLGFMMRLFMDAWDGRALSVDPSGAAYDGGAARRWLAGSGGIDVQALERAGLIALERSEPLLVLATSFALVAMLDALGGRQLRCPRRTVVMQTGGFKGKSREVEPRALRRQVARAFRIAPEQVVGEYGMTELTSQLYEVRGEEGVYLEPHWLRVVPVDSATLKAVDPGEVGIAKIIDLGNVDSAVAIVTQDQVQRTERGVRLLGRRKGAPARGCSLALEALVR